MKKDAAAKPISKRVMKGVASPNRNQAIAQSGKEIEISLMGRRKLRENACGSLCDQTFQSGGARCVPYYTAWALRRDAEPSLHSEESGEIGAGNYARFLAPWSATLSKV